MTDNSRQAGATSAAVAGCVILVPGGGPGGGSVEPECEETLAQLSRRGYEVRRGGGEAVRCRMATEALRDGFHELVWIGPHVLFDPDDVDKLRARGLPIVCGLYPTASGREFACRFPLDLQTIALGQEGGLLELLSSGLGFAYTHRVVFDTLRRELQLPECPIESELAAPSAAGARSSVVPYFQPLIVGGSGPPRYLGEEYAFCERARRSGFKVMADATIRLSVIGKSRFSWEDVGVRRERLATYYYRPGFGGNAPVNAPPQAPTAPAAPALPGSTNRDSQHPDRNRLRPAPGPLPSGFPQMKAYAVTYEKNLPSMELTAADFRESDWGDELQIFTQPTDWPISFDSASRNYRRALEAAAQSGCDYALIIEDDVRVCRSLRRNLMALPLIQRDQCDFLSLYIPDVIQSPWERQEPHLGYRLAKSLYSGPNDRWEKFRLWGSQGCVLSRRFIVAALERWDALREGIDSRLISVCSQLQLPMWYTSPCLVEHAPLRSAFASPPAHAPDYQRDFQLVVQSGFQPPEEIPGWFSLSEGQLLYQTAKDREVLELGTCKGRSTVCLAQSARSVVSVDLFDQDEAAQWVARFGLTDRVEFRQGDVEAVTRQLSGSRFDLVFIDTEHDEASVTRDMRCALPLLKPHGLIAFHDYPDPGWPDVRRVVDDHARRLHWNRIAQSDYLGVFQT